MNQSQLDDVKAAMVLQFEESGPDDRFASITITDSLTGASVVAPLKLFKCTVLGHRMRRYFQVAVDEEIHKFTRIESNWFIPDVVYQLEEPTL